MTRFDLFLMWVRAKLSGFILSEAEPTEEASEEPAQNSTERQHVTGYDIVYHVPEDMKAVTIEIQEPNGRVQQSIVISDYVTIQPSARLRVKVRS